MTASGGGRFDGLRPKDRRKKLARSVVIVVGAGALGAVGGGIGTAVTAVQVAKAIHDLVRRYKLNITKEDIEQLLQPNSAEFKDAVDAFLRSKRFTPGSSEYTAAQQEIVRRFEALSSEATKVAADFVERAIGPVVAAGNIGLDGLSGEALEEAYLAEFLHDEYRRVASHYRLHFYEGLEAPERGTFLLHLMGCEATFRFVGIRTMICERAMDLAKAMQDLVDPDQERERDRVYRLIYGL
jgi:hypothetical protein